MGYSCSTRFSLWWEKRKWRERDFLLKCPHLLVMASETPYWLLTRLTKVKSEWSWGVPPCWNKYNLKWTHWYKFWGFMWIQTNATFSLVFFLHFTNLWRKCDRQTDGQNPFERSFSHQNGPRKKLKLQNSKDHQNNKKLCHGQTERRSCLHRTRR